jgi:predicted phage terminase large subunit-like protein
VLCDSRRCRRKPKGVEDLIRETAREDGREVEICIAQERGAAGKNLVDHYARHVLQGYLVRGVPEVAPGSSDINAAPDHPKRAKILRAGPASAAMQRGEMDAVRGTYVGPLFDELEAFPAAGVHDDQVDALAGAVMRLNRPEFWAA